MKHLLFALFLVVSGFTFAQDTTNVYVINNTNRLIRISQSNGPSTYVIEYRNLKKLNDTASVYLGRKEDVYKFFNTCEKVLNTDTRIIGEHYNVNRNKVDKNTVKVDNKMEGAYFLVKRETLENMKSAMDSEP